MTALSYKSAARPPILLEFKKDCSFFCLFANTSSRLSTLELFLSMAAIRNRLPPIVALANYGPHYLANMQLQPLPTSVVVSIDSALGPFPQSFEWMVPKKKQTTG